MTDTQHTPGPWVIDRNPVEHLGFTIGVPASEAMPPASQRHIGNVFYAANARLIAAAPELLAALQDLAEEAARSVYPQPDKPDSAWAKLVRARAAIAKATGQTA